MVPWVLQVPKFRGSNGAGVDGAAGGVGVGLAGVSGVVGGVGALGIGLGSGVGSTEVGGGARGGGGAAIGSRAGTLRFPESGRERLSSPERSGMAVEGAAGTVAGVPGEGSSRSLMLSKSRLSRLPSSPGTVIGVVGLAGKAGGGSSCTAVGCAGTGAMDNKGAPRRADSSL